MTGLADKIGLRLGPVGGAVAGTTGLADKIGLRLGPVGGAVAGTTGLADKIGLRLSVLDSVAGSTALALIVCRTKLGTVGLDTLGFPLDPRPFLSLAGSS